MMSSADVSVIKASFLESSNVSVRHQAISRSVQEADRFLMITNLAWFCGEIANIVLIVYTAIFHQNYIMSFGAQAAVVYLTWLGLNVLGLSLAAGLAAIINHIVSNTYCLCLML